MRRKKKLEPFSFSWEESGGGAIAPTLVSGGDPGSRSEMPPMAAVECVGVVGLTWSSRTAIEMEEGLVGEMHSGVAYVHI